MKLFVIACAAVTFSGLLLLCQALPTEQIPLQASNNDPEWKMAPGHNNNNNNNNNNNKMAVVSGDEYDEIMSNWKQPKDVSEYVPEKPQTGSLLSLEEEPVNSLQPTETAQNPSIPAATTEQSNTTTTTTTTTTTNTTAPAPATNNTLVSNEVDPFAPKASAQEPNAVAARKPSLKIDDASDLTATVGTTPNEIQNHMPVEIDHASSDRIGYNDTLAPVPVVDPKQLDVHGVYSAPVVFSKPEDVHPMEVTTPLIDPEPCDAERIIMVSVPAAIFDQSMTVPTLPARYGCSSADDVSREKASPAITWSNVYEDVVDFSLQMIDLGPNCSGKGDSAGRIHWHITGIQKSPSVTLQEGASRDSRLLYGGREEPNQWLEEYYAGPCPAPGSSSCYRIKVLAHRSNGHCQCGHQDILFARAYKPIETPWTYEDSSKHVAAPAAKAKQM